LSGFQNLSASWRIPEPVRLPADSPNKNVLKTASAGEPKNKRRRRLKKTAVRSADRSEAQVQIF